MSIIHSSIESSYGGYYVSQMLESQKEVERARLRTVEGLNHFDLTTDPQAYQQVSQLNGALYDSNQAIGTIKTFELDTKTQYQALENINEIMIQTIAIPGQSQAYGADLSQLARQVNSLQNSLVQAANTQDLAGKYIFGGYKNDQPPFQVVTSGSTNTLQFNGVDYDNNQKVGPIENETLSIDFPPNQFFKDLYATLDQLSQHLNNKTSVVPDIANINKSLDEVRKHMVNAGETLKKLEVQSNIKAKRVLDLKNQISNIKDMPLSQSITDQDSKKRTSDVLLISYNDMMKSENERMRTIFSRH